MKTTRLPAVTLLVLAFPLGVFGCGSTNADKSATEPSEAIAQVEKAIQRETWISEPVTLESASEIQVTTSLATGPAVDVYLMSEAGFNKWDTVVSKGQESSDPTFEHFAALGLEGLSNSFTSAWTELPAGTYYLVIDNSSFGGTAPPGPGSDDIATVDFKVESRAIGK